MEVECKKKWREGESDQRILQAFEVSLWMYIQLKGWPETFVEVCPLELLDVPHSLISNYPLRRDHQAICLEGVQWVQASQILSLPVSAFWWYSSSLYLSKYGKILHYCITFLKVWSKWSYYFIWLVSLNVNLTKFDFISILFFWQTYRMVCLITTSEEQLAESPCHFNSILHYCDPFYSILLPHHIISSYYSIDRFYCK